MSIYYARQNVKRSGKCRRITDRRNIPHPFGSVAWIENIKKHYLAWPKIDRRETDRRNNVRRDFQQAYQPISEQRRSEQKYSPILLTQEERTMIQDLYIK